MKMRIAIALLAFAVPLHAGSNIVATSAALSTASPYATSAGLSVLKRGGNAIDAAVAVEFALAVVHLQAGNIGGGGFLVYYDAKTKGTWVLDFRETAPAAATRDMFLQSDGKLSPDIRTGPKSAAVPGTVGVIPRCAQSGSPRSVPPRQRRPVGRRPLPLLPRRPRPRRPLPLQRRRRPRSRKPLR
jgi:gamma-glutamyltranspeptidase